MPPRLPHALLATTLATSALLAPGCRQACTSQRASGPPDVYVIIVDTLRADHLGTYGYVNPTTPEIDAWSQDAVVFDRAYTVAPWTLPTVATMMTGHHPYALGIREEQSSIDDSVTTLGELFSAAGYATGAVVSHIYLLPKYRLMQGLDFLDTEMVKDSHEIISSQGVTDRALSYLQEHVATQGDRPFFMVVQYFDPHYEYILHPDLYDSFPEYDGPITSNQSVHAQRKVLAGLDGQELADARRNLVNLYDSELRYTDQQIGRLLDGIEATGRSDNALIVLVGDHGEELGERPSKWIGHTKVVSEEVLRVPLAMKLPGGAQPRKRIAEPVSLVDMMPTIAAEAGLKLPDDHHTWGRPLDLASSADYRPILHAETGRWATIQVAIKDNWKLLSYPKSSRGQVTLYDLATDPGETRSVAAEHPEIVAELTADLADWNTALEADRKILDPAVGEPYLSKEEEEALRAMGYIE